MKTLYVSTPMQNKSQVEIESNISYCYNDAETLLKDKLTLIDTMSNILKFDTFGECLASNLQLLAKADYAYFDDNWQTSRGCKIEHDFADAYGIKIIRD